MTKRSGNDEEMEKDMEEIALGLVGKAKREREWKMMIRHWQLDASIQETSEFMDIEKSGEMREK